jgi:dTMP kinase
MLNKLIVLEGTDGAGKSTQVEKVKNYLTLHSLKYEFFHFPMYGHNEFSYIIGAFLRGEFGDVDDVDPYFVANIYAMDRFLFLPMLKKAIEENDIVLLDRYVFSNLAFQGAKYKDPAQSATIKNWIHQFEFNFLKLPYPDLSIFFDVPMDVVKKRLDENRTGKDREYLMGQKDIHEADLNFQSRVRDNYLGLVGASNYKIIPCVVNNITLTPDDLFESYKFLLDQTVFES